MTAADRSMIRVAVNEARRAQMATSRCAIDRRKVQPPTPRPTPVSGFDFIEAEVSEQIQEARQPALTLVPQIVTERPKQHGWCPYCGAPCDGPACWGHIDLFYAERDLYQGRVAA